MVGLFFLADWCSWSYSGWWTALKNVDLTVSKSAEHAAKLVAELQKNQPGVDPLKLNGTVGQKWVPQCRDIDNAVPGKPVAWIVLMVTPCGQILRL